MGQDISVAGKRKRFENSPELIQDIQKIFLERWNIDANEVSNIGFEVAAAGSSVLQIALRETWDNSDLDLYVNYDRRTNTENIQTLENYVLSKNYIKTQEWPAKLPFIQKYPEPSVAKYNLLPDVNLYDAYIPKPYQEEIEGDADTKIPYYSSGGFMERNSLKKIMSFKNVTTNATLQIVACYKELRDTIDSFDLDVCSLSYMFLNKYVYLSKDMDPERIMKRQIMMRGEYMSLYADGNYVLHRRVQKYESRNFTIINKPKLTGFIRSVNKAINRLNDDMGQCELILENLLYTNYSTDFKQNAFQTRNSEKRNLQGVGVWNHFTGLNISLRKVLKEGEDSLSQLFDQLENAQDEDQKQLIIRKLRSIETKLRYRIHDDQIKITMLLNKRDDLSRGETDLLKTKTEKVVEKALFYERFRNALVQKVKLSSVEYRAMLQRFIEEGTPEIMLKANYLLDRLSGENFTESEKSFNCSNFDDRDPFTFEAISDLEPINTFKNIVFNDQGQVQRIQCYDLDSLITWIESKEKPKRNQWGRYPDPEPGTFPDTGRQLDPIERLRYTTATNIRKCTVGISLLTQKFNKYKQVLDEEKPEFPFEKALIGGKKRRKIKAKLRRRRKVNK